MFDCINCIHACVCMRHMGGMNLEPCEDFDDKTGKMSDATYNKIMDILSSAERYLLCDELANAVNKYLPWDEAVQPDGINTYDKDAVDKFWKENK